MPDASGRRLALRNLKVADEASLEMLYLALADEDPGVRREAVRLITRSPHSPGLLLTLERALTDQLDLARRSSAMEALAAMGKSALPLLGRLAADPRVSVRRLAVDALGLSRMPESVDVLERCARDPQSSVRTAALEAVARTGAPRASAILLRAAEDRGEQPAVVLAALIGLLLLNKSPSLHTLKRLADDPLTAPPALRLLGRVGEAGFLVDVLVATTGSQQRAAVLGLAEALEQGTAPPRLKSTEAIHALRALVQSADIQIACAALIAAAHAGDVEIIAQAAARDDRAHLSSAAHKALSILEGRPPGSGDLAATLRMLVADDAPGSELVLELADAAARARERPLRKGPPGLDDRAFARLARLFESAAGIVLAEDARVRIEARLLPRVEELHCPDFNAYIEILTAHDPRAREELQLALERVTVHETYLFRERAQLNAFRDEILPSLRHTGPVRVWSAGTSTGQEAYTLAILLEEAGALYEVLGTDLSREALAAARTGRYSPRSFRGEIEPELRKRWFVYELNGVVVHPDLKRHVRFEQLNLLDERAAARVEPVDVIFCRNVLIYMSAHARARVIDLFWQKLRPGGVLLLGHCESLLHVDTPFKLKPLCRGLGYEKPAATSLEQAQKEGGGQ